jgi:hypothetical protein
MIMKYIHACSSWHTTGRRGLCTGYLQVIFLKISSDVKARQNLESAQNYSKHTKVLFGYYFLNFDFIFWTKRCVNNLVPRACDPREGTRGSGIIRCRKPGILAKIELRIHFNGQSDSSLKLAPVSHDLRAVKFRKSAFDKLLLIITN